MVFYLTLFKCQIFGNMKIRLLLCAVKSNERLGITTKEMITLAQDLTQFNLIASSFNSTATHYILYGYDTTPRVGTIETKPNSRRVDGFFAFGTEANCLQALEFIKSK